MTFELCTGANFISIFIGLWLKFRFFNDFSIDFTLIHQFGLKIHRTQTRHTKKNTKGICTKLKPIEHEREY